MMGRSYRALPSLMPDLPGSPSEGQAEDRDLGAPALKPASLASLIVPPQPVAGPCVV